MSQKNKRTFDLNKIINDFFFFNLLSEDFIKIKKNKKKNINNKKMKKLNRK